MKKEIWKAVEGYEGWYEVSNFGNVRSLDRVISYPNGKKCLWKGRIIKLKRNTNGYITCSLYKNTKTMAYRVHRLVAQAFIPNPDNLPFINHKDEIKTNNYVENLEWCTRSYNVNYGTAIQRRLIKLSKPVLQIDKITNEVITEYPSAAEAGRKNGFSQGAISACCRGKCKTAYGFKWRYQD